LIPLGQARDERSCGRDRTWDVGGQGLDTLESVELELDRAVGLVGPMILDLPVVDDALAAAEVIASGAVIVDCSQSYSAETFGRGAESRVD